MGKSKPGCYMMLAYGKFEMSNVFENLGLVI